MLLKGGNLSEAVRAHDSACSLKFELLRLLISAPFTDICVAETLKRHPRLCVTVYKKRKMENPPKPKKIPLYSCSEVLNSSCTSEVRTKGCKAASSHPAPSDCAKLTERRPRFPALHWSIAHTRFGGASLDEYLPGRMGIISASTLSSARVIGMCGFEWNWGNESTQTHTHTQSHTCTVQPINHFNWLSE